MEVLNYCVFIDVLGYGELVKDTTKSIDQRINILNSINNIWIMAHIIKR